MTQRGTIRLLVLGAFVLVAASPAQANTFTFTCITNNSATDCGVGVAQIGVSISAVGANQVSFLFTNSGSTASFIGQVFFDSSLLAGINTINNGTGVLFTVDSKAGNLPAGNTVGFTTDFSAGKSKAASNGVNPGEQVEIVVNLANGVTFNDVLAAMNNGVAIVGIHMQGFPSGGSESFVNAPPPQNPPPNTPVPEPATLLMLGTGLVGLAGIVRKRLAA